MIRGSTNPLSIVNRFFIHQFEIGANGEREGSGIYPSTHRVWFRMRLAPIRQRCRLPQNPQTRTAMGANMNRFAVDSIGLKFINWTFISEVVNRCGIGANEEWGGVANFPEKPRQSFGGELISRLIGAIIKWDSIRIFLWPGEGGNDQESQRIPEESLERATESQPNRNQWQSLGNWIKFEILQHYQILGGSSVILLLSNSPPLPPWRWGRILSADSCWNIWFSFWNQDITKILPIQWGFFPEGFTGIHLGFFSEAGDAWERHRQKERKREREREWKQSALTSLSLDNMKTTEKHLQWPLKIGNDPGRGWHVILAQMCSHMRVIHSLLLLLLLLPPSSIPEISSSRQKLIKPNFIRLKSINNPKRGESRNNLKESRRTALPPPTRQSPPQESRWRQRSNLTTTAIIII